jgi:hypothetical protein
MEISPEDFWGRGYLLVLQMLDILIYCERGKKGTFIISAQFIFSKTKAPTFRYCVTVYGVCELYYRHIYSFNPIYM